MKCMDAVAKMIDAVMEAAHKHLDTDPAAARRPARHRVGLRQNPLLPLGFDELLNNQLLEFDFH